jgi:DNA-binding transcriptional regulator YdaS (Cro superfamily)
VRETLHTRVVFRAVQVKGDAAALALAIGVSAADVQAWMHSATPLPERYFMRLLDIIAEETLRGLTDGAAGGSSNASS